MRKRYTLLIVLWTIMVISCNKVQLAKEDKEIKQAFANQGKTNIAYKDLLRQMDSLEKVLDNQRKEAVMFFYSLKEKDSMKYDKIVEEIERRLNSSKDNEYSNYSR